MPSSITHQLVAEEALKLLPPEAKAAAERFPDEYFLGCQGPDMFFFYRIGNRSEYNLGKFLHRYRVYDVFSLFLSALRGKEGAPRFGETEKMQALSYVLGYITHYAADTAFHPFVYNYLKEYRCEKRVHQQMENDWDVWFLREKKNAEAEKFRFAFSPAKIIGDGAAARLYAYLALGLEREEVTKARFARGVKNFSRYLKFFHGKCYSAQRGWERTEKFFHAKRFLSRLFPRENPDPAFLSGEHFWELSEERGHNADELFGRAVSEGARLGKIFLSVLQDGGELPKEEFSNSLLTAKPVD